MPNLFKQLTVLAIILCPLLSFTQVYYPFPTDSAEWDVAIFGSDPFGYPECFWTHHYGMYGDTLISGESWSKVYKNNIDTSFVLSNAVYYGAVREDSLRRVWLIFGGDTLQHIIYDFGKEPADTVCAYLADPSMMDFCGEVSTQDSVACIGHYRKRHYIFTGYGNEAWIEGIGNERGPFEHEIIASSWANLLCFRSGGTEIFKLNPGAGCHCGSGTGSDMDPSMASALASVYPNPSSGQFRIESRLNEPLEIKLIDPAGKLLRIIPIPPDQRSFKMSQVPKGMYFLEVSTAGGRKEIHKLMVW